MTLNQDTLFLRRILALDAVASGATGLLMAFGSTLLADYLMLEAGVTQPAGLFLIAWASGIAALALRPRPPRTLVMAVIAVNILWVAGSVLALVQGWLQPNVLGVTFVLAQAVAVAGFAALQLFTLRTPGQTA